MFAYITSQVTINLKATLLDRIAQHKFSNQNVKNVYISNI